MSYPFVVEKRSGYLGITTSLTLSPAIIDFNMNTSMVSGIQLYHVTSNLCVYNYIYICVLHQLLEIYPYHISRYRVKISSYRYVWWVNWAKSEVKSSLYRRSDYDRPMGWSNWHPYNPSVNCAEVLGGRFPWKICKLLDVSLNSCWITMSMLSPYKNFWN